MSRAGAAVWGQQELNETLPFGQGPAPCRRRRGLIDLINAVIYTARDRYRWLRLLPPELPPLRCFLRWPGRAVWKLWLHHVLLPSVQRRRPTEQVVGQPWPTIPAGTKHRLRRVAMFCQEMWNYVYWTRRVTVGCENGPAGRPGEPQDCRRECRLIL